MEQNIIDLSTFEEVTSANSLVKRQNFRLKVNYTKCMFTFSDALFSELSLATNSLKQYNKMDGMDAGVYFVLYPANTGVWMKKKANSEKGKTHKNEKFVEALGNFGVTSTTLDLVYVGPVGDRSLYKVVVTEPLDPAAEDDAQAGSVELPADIFDQDTDPVDELAENPGPNTMLEPLSGTTGTVQ